MAQEGVNVKTVGNMLYQVTAGTVEAGGGALLTGITAGEIKLMVTPYLGVKSLEQRLESETAITAPKGYQFTQKTYSTNFSNETGSTFPYKGQPVQSVVNGLKSGSISTSEIPVNVIERESVNYIMNSRSYASSVLSGKSPNFIYQQPGMSDYNLWNSLLDEKLIKTGGETFCSIIPSLVK
jgi:hypothetical protein